MVTMQIDYERLYRELYDEMAELNRQLVQNSPEGPARSLALEQQRVLEKAHDHFLFATKECVQYEKEMQRRCPRMKR